LRKTRLVREGTKNPFLKRELSDTEDGSSPTMCGGWTHRPVPPKADKTKQGAKKNVVQQTVKRAQLNATRIGLFRGPSGAHRLRGSGPRLVRGPGHRYLCPALKHPARPTAPRP